MNYRCSIRIELLSDLCVSDGSAYNSLVDTDVCVDSYGFPYIPAKRLRGCLRECAGELNDWGDDIRVNLLFGREGAEKNGARFNLGNAYLENYDELVQFAAENKGHILVHPQNVLATFSYMRTQTSIDYETGVSSRTSLRTIRVVNKGLVFCAEVEIDREYLDELRRCCKILRHMGLARTRGLGEVSVSVDEALPVKPNHHAALVQGANELSYEIKLLEPVICKSHSGGEEHTLDYIEGSKMLGIIAGAMGDEYVDFSDKGDLKCTNAYISKNHVRFTEIPGYIYKIKNNKGNYINKLLESGDDSKKEAELGRQLGQMPHCYAVIKNGKLQKTEVVTESRNHHRRPEDKSIGRAVSNEGGNADFYQMESISEGQTFAGKIIGSPEQIHTVYKILTEDRDFHIGYSRSSEYGKVRIQVVGTGNSEEEAEARIKSNTIVVDLKSPAIVYSKMAMTTTDPEALKEEVLKALDIDKEPRLKKYIRNVTIGGYNVTWNRPRPTLKAFDKGTSLKLAFDEDIEICSEKTVFLGERTAEGYGEAVVRVPDTSNDKYEGEIISEEKVGRTKPVEASSEFAHMLAEPLFDSYIRREAVRAAASRKNEKSDKYKATISNMMLMCKESESLSDIEAAVEDRFSKNSEGKEDKKDAAEKILKEVKGQKKLVDSFSKELSITGYSVGENEFMMKFLEEYLTQLKYELRKKDQNGRKGN